MKRDQYINEVKELSWHGYCVIRDLIDEPMLKSLRERFGDESLSAHTPKDNFGDSGAFIVANYRDPVLVRLLTWPRTLGALKSMGFTDPKLHNFYVSTKTPKAEALAWHSDLFYKYEEPEPAELFLIYYLQDTTPNNGCLRVVPGSHKWSHKKRHEQPHDARPREDEVDVPVNAGDLFVGDRRIMHATHANSGSTWRTCLTIAYAPNFSKLPDPIKALIVQNRCLPLKGWWNDSQLTRTIDPRFRDVLPIYKGAAAPIKVE